MEILIMVFFMFLASAALHVCYDTQQTKIVTIALGVATLLLALYGQAHAGPMVEAELSGRTYTGRLQLDGRGLFLGLSDPYGLEVSKRVEQTLYKDDLGLLRACVDMGVSSSRGMLLGVGLSIRNKALHTGAGVMVDKTGPTVYVRAGL